MRCCSRFLALALTLAAAPLMPSAAFPHGESKFTLSDDEKKLVELVNRERKKHDLAPLQPSPVLCRVARAHAANMAKQGKMAHVLDGKDQFQRIKGAGYKYSYAGENVARGEVAMAEVVQGWMESKVHRKIILGAKYTETGVGLARGADALIYYTQVFAVPRTDDE